MNLTHSQESETFLSNGTAIPRPFAIAILVNLGLSTFTLLLLFLNYGATHRFANKEVPSLVQLADGTTVRVAPVPAEERSSQVIKTFVSQTFVEMFNWNGVLPSWVRPESTPTTPIQDPGVEIKNRARKIHGKITTGAWYASFALEETFRERYVEELAKLTPAGVFERGRIRVVLVPRLIGIPRRIGKGRWTVNFIGNLVFFERGEAGKAIAFNKKIVVRAIDTPNIPETMADELTKQIYRVRRAGLEIESFVELEVDS